MILKLPYAEAIAAQRELKALRQRARMTGVSVLDPMLLRVIRTLMIDRQPLVAACELKFIAERTPEYPHLQRRLLAIAKQIHPFMDGESPTRHQAPAIPND